MWLGVIFASLVVPFALDGQWTAATWAIEGAGLVWAGLRQSRYFALYFGIIIQFAGGCLFLVDINLAEHDSFAVNAQLLGRVFVSIVALFSSYQVWSFRHSF